MSNIILIENLIANAKTEDAIIEFEKMVLDKDEDTSKTLILLKSKIRLLKDEHLQGVIERGDFHRGILQVGSGVLDLINDFVKKRKSYNIIRFEKEIIPDPISRQKKIGYFAKQLYDQGEYSVLRQRAVLSSFAIPNRESSDTIWRSRDEIKQRESEHFESAYSERKWLEKHTNMTYAKLILQPSNAIGIAQRRGKNAGLLRLKCLLEFLQSNMDKVDVVIADNFKKENLIILGDWFYSHSTKPTDYGFENTSFEWEKGLVQAQIDGFENEFDDLLIQKGLDVYDSKREVIEQIQNLINEISKY